MLSLLPPSLDDVRELLSFEESNRQFFEQSINARPAGFYSEEGVAQAIELASKEADRDAGYQYLVRDPLGSIVGRVNLTRVRRAHFHSAELGYRIGQSAAGKGYASEAVRQVLDKAFGTLGLLRIEATCRPENEGSLKVLGRTGFSQFGRSRQSFELGGRWYDLLHFERRADA
ncbi:MAG: GNAT family N-acetyltransferase [Acidovorax sp.]|jgi:[ribosomal protein S5]-alanine N-acetyltransferase